MSNVISNSTVSSNALISNAFKAADNATKQGNNSVQGMAAGIMLYHAETATSSRASFDKMRERGEAFNLLKKELVDAFITPRVSGKQPDTFRGSWDDHVARTNRTNATQMVALNKGFDLAIALHSIGVTSGNYDGKVGLFMVPVASLLKSGESAFGRLHKLEKDDAPVALDGAAYRYEDADGKMQSFTAFPAHILKVAGYVKVKKAAVASTTTGDDSNGASNTSTTGGATAAAINADTSTWSLEHVATMIAKLAVTAQGIMEVEPPMPYSEWPVELVNAVTELCILRDDAMAAEAQRKAA